MLPAIFLIISMILLLITFLRKGKQKEIPTMMELEMYYDMIETQGTTQKTIKQLLECAVKILSKIEELNMEREKIWGLYDDKLISDRIWNHINDSLSDYQYLKMIVRMEANKIHDGYGDKIFNDATLLLVKEKMAKEKYKKDRRKKEDSLYHKKKEVLERILRDKLLKARECAKESNITA